MRTLAYVCILLLLFLPSADAFAQVKTKVEIIPKLQTQFLANSCGKLKPGKIISNSLPFYPAEAKAALIGGSVWVEVKLNTKGTILEIEKVSGNKLLQGSAVEAARKIKFSPTICDNFPVEAKATLVYNYFPYFENVSYTKSTKIEDFSDVVKSSQFYEAILNLTENYQISFGYSNKNFYVDAPLTRGDLSQFMLLTLDLLSERARIAGKLPREIGLFYSFNPQNLKTPAKIKGLGKNEPATESFKVLLQKYDIVLVNEKKEFHGRLPVTKKEVLEIWSKIFGSEAVPINFVSEHISDPQEILMSRGEFALFLNESLDVLAYKVLP